MKEKVNEEGKKLRPTPFACVLKIQGTITSVYKVFV